MIRGTIFQYWQIYHSISKFPVIHPGIAAGGIRLPVREYIYSSVTNILPIDCSYRRMELIIREYQNWLDKTDTSEIGFFDYWNDEEIEKEKEWYTLNGNFRQMEDYIESSGLSEDLRTCVQVLVKGKKIYLRGTGIDLAAGNLWAVPHLLECGEIHTIYCLEYSKHRLLKLGTSVLDHYHVPREKAILVYGSFYDLHLEDMSLDFILLSSAFHHAEFPDRLLKEMKRVLKPEGCVIILGEPSPNFVMAYCRYFVRLSISRILPRKIQEKIFHRTFRAERIIPRGEDLIPTDPCLGDHYYLSEEYRNLFRSQGFVMQEIRSKNASFKSFILTLHP